MIDRPAVCLFCEQTIAANGLDPCALTVTAHADQVRQVQKEQIFYCHLACLKQRAAINPRNFYIEDPEFPSVDD